ncbi:MAG TPA: hypothetical protein VHE35_25600 [Kofleriaceae bacterium]|nr:hypothetical protein [Kofleriaceae bacterium]
MIDAPFPVPPRPDLPPDAVATAAFPLRYEDVAQDGRMTTTAIPPAIGWTVWRQLLGNHPASKAMQQVGLVAILSRLTVDGTDQPIRPDRPAEATGGYQLAHAAREGAVDKLFLNMWVEVRGVRGRLFPREPAGEPVVAGRVFAEHTFTRLFAPPDQRRVTRLELPGMPEVPPAVHPFAPPATAMELPAGAIALDEEYVADTTTTAFGLDHTDSNQHVNSLVYPRLFAEAALRRLAALGLPRAGLVRSLDIAYRKPSFAGDQVRVHLRAFRLGERLGAAGFVADAGDPTRRPRCCARILLG